MLIRDIVFILVYNPISMEATKTLSIHQSLPADPYEKGRLFEQYIIDLFSKKRFRVDKWRESKKLTTPEQWDDCSNPDIELTFHRNKTHRFAVECKWRNAFDVGKIKWATESQIEIYKRFQRKLNMPVFVAIGVGGHPSEPQNLFVTPLCNIEEKPIVYQHELIVYNRNPKHRFFYDVNQLLLF